MQKISLFLRKALWRSCNHPQVASLIATKWSLFSYRHYFLSLLFSIRLIPIIIDLVFTLFTFTLSITIVFILCVCSCMFSLSGTVCIHYLIQQETSGSINYILDNAFSELDPRYIDTCAPGYWLLLLKMCKHI